MLFPQLCRRCCPVCAGSGPSQPEDDVRHLHANIEEKDIAEAIRCCAAETVHVHISENDRSTPGEGHVDWDTTFKTLKEVGYDGWFVVEAFGLALPDLAAATKIWRRMFPTEEHLATKALEFMKSNWEG